MGDAAANEKSQLAKQYLENTVVPVLTQALTQMCVTEPEDPFTWLAQVLSLCPVFSIRKIALHPHKLPLLLLVTAREVQYTVFRPQQASLTGWLAGWTNIF